MQRICKLTNLIITWNSSIDAIQRVGYFVLTTSDYLIGGQRKRTRFSQVAFERIRARTIQIPMIYI